MYKLLSQIKTPFGMVDAKVVQRIFENAFIPFDPANTDYQQFKRDIAEGAELQDADGAVMSADAAKAFVGTLP